MAVENKIHPRNRTAANDEPIAGNPVSARLESGVGNCFPGLEFDIRNLERRFFPFFAVDLIGSFALVMDVNIAAARLSNEVTPAQLTIYERLARDTADPDEPVWLVLFIEANFGPYGDMRFELATAGGAGRPADAWTAVRLIPEGGPIVLTLGQQQRPERLTLEGRRQAYLDDRGALRSFFAPGEMTQSLCSPWTHDFRDCGCYYWASNHPDIVQIQKPEDAPPSDEGDRMIAWQRSVKGTFENPPAPARPDQRSAEMAYYEINHRWQELAVVLDGREQGGAYAPKAFSATPLPDMATLIEHLEYAAGVELAVMQEYLTAAYSLRQNPVAAAADDVRAANAEIMRVAIGEMRHLRAVNDVLRELKQRDAGGPFVPALRVAAELPAGGTNFRPVTFRPLTAATLTDFIEIERPSFSVDGLYGRIFATLRRDVPGPLADAVGLIIAEGTEHFETFLFIQEWLRGHNEADYLGPTQQPNPGNALHQALQQRYATLLDTLFRAYRSGMPAGAALVAEARSAMLADDGIAGACKALAVAGLLVTFETPNDPRFASIPRP
jgi:hypothetical protein